MHWGGVELSSQAEEYLSEDSLETEIFTDSVLEEIPGEETLENGFSDENSLEGMLFDEGTAKESGTISLPLDFTNVGDEPGQTPVSGNGYAWSGDEVNGYSLILDGLRLENLEETGLDEVIILPRNGNVNIVVRGDNIINIPDADKAIGCAGVSSSTGTLTVTGEGTLTVNVDGNVIAMGNTVTIQGIKMMVTCVQGGIRAQLGDMIVTDADITVKSQGKSAPALAVPNGSLTVTNSKLDLESIEDGGLRATKELNIIGGETTVIGSAVGYPAIWGGDISVKDRAKITVTNKSTESSFGIFADQKLFLGDLVEVTASANTSSIVTKGTATMSETAKVTLPEGTTAELLKLSNFPFTNNLVIGDKLFKWDGEVLTYVLSSIEVTTQPTKTNYTYGEKFEMDGMTVTATYSDDTTKDITEYVVFSDILTVGQTSVTLSYTEDEITKNCTVDGITVNKATPTGTPKYTAITGSGKTLKDAGLTVEGSTFSVLGTVVWKLPEDTKVEANTRYEWEFTPSDSNNYNNLTGSIELWHHTTTYYTLSFNTNGGSSISSITYSSGSVIKLSNYKPTRENCEFAGWYADAELKTPVTEITLYGNKTVYAKWIVPGLPDGTEVLPDGSFETPDGVIVKPDGNVVLPNGTIITPDENGNKPVVDKEGSVTAPDGTVYKPDGTVHHTDGSVQDGDGAYIRPGKGMIDYVTVKGNCVTTYLVGESAGAQGYDYVIGTSADMLKTKEYYEVNKNQVDIDTSMYYVQKGTYYAACHAWIRGEDGKKVFGSWSDLEAFEVTATTPAVPRITKVSVKGRTVTVTYTKSQNAAGYDVVLGASVKKVNGEPRPVDYGKRVKKNISGNTVTVTFRNCPKGVYYAGLHAYNRSSADKKKVFSPWSNTKKAIVK